MAGTWSELESRGGSLDNVATGIKSFGAEFTADATDLDATQLEVGTSAGVLAGFLQRFSVKFDGTVPPEGITFTVKIVDRDGVAIGNPDGTALTETSNITVNQYGN